MNYMTSNRMTQAAPKQEKNIKDEELEPLRRLVEPKSLIQTMRSWLKETFEGKQPESLREVLEEAMEEHDEALAQADPEERLLLRNLLEFGELEVNDVMVPRADIIGVPEDVTLEQLQRLSIENAHSRYPVYRGTLDEVIGLVHTKDLLRYIGSNQAFDLHAMLRPMSAVPASMKVLDLLVKLRAARTHMAIVVDEYGGTDGLVTLEDIFETLVGDIQDEHDEDEAEGLHWLNSTTLQVGARIELEQLEHRLGRDLRPNDDEESYDTLAGLLVTEFGYVPKKGESLHYRGLRFEVEAADSRRVLAVKITLPEPLNQS